MLKQTMLSLCLFAVTMFVIIVDTSNDMESLQESVTSSQEPMTSQHGGLTTPEEPVTSPQEGQTAPEETVTSPQEGQTAPREPVTSTQRGLTTPQEPVTSPQEGQTTPQEPVTSPQGSLTTPQEPVTSPHGPVNQEDEFLTAVLATEQQCHAMCVYVKPCVTYCWQVQTRHCLLKPSGKMCSRCASMSEPGWVHGSLDTFRIAANRLCGGRPCQAMEMCIPMTSGAVCLPLGPTIVDTTATEEPKTGVPGSSDAISPKSTNPSISYETTPRGSTTTTSESDDETTTRGSNTSGSETATTEDDVETTTEEYRTTKRDPKT